ncbi:MAG TPA: hypothetical protein VF414_00490 [Thermoanaerobaculia bacterium]
MTVSVSTFLRRVLALDAVTSGAMGALLVLAQTPLSSLLGLSSSLLFWAGLSLLPFAAFVGWLATRELPPRAGVWAVVLINALWVVDSFVLLASGWPDLTLLGKVFVLFQAVAVAVFAELQFFGLRRSGRLAAA